MTETLEVITKWTTIAIGVAAIASLVINLISTIISNRRTRKTVKVTTGLEMVSQANLINLFFGQQELETEVDTPYATFAKEKWNQDNANNNLVKDPKFNKYAVIFFHHMNFLYKAYLQQQTGEDIQTARYENWVKHVLKPYFSAHRQFELIRQLLIDKTKFDLWPLDFKKWLKEEACFDLEQPFPNKSRL